MMMQPLAQTASSLGAALPDGIPATEPAAASRELSLLGLVEVLLKEPRRLDDLNREEARQAELMPRFLAISLASFALFGVALSLILHFTPPAAYPHRLLPVPRVNLGDSSGLALVLAYSLGMVAASGLCLPSFYFFALLAGVKMRLSQIVSQVMCSKATTAVVLVGILPIYVAVVLGMVVFEADASLLETCLYLGLALPFVAGLAGVRALYRGVSAMSETMPPERRCRRACFLRRLTVSWAACYTAVSPVLIYRLWETLAPALA
ncbi:MAG: hypothetical protein HYS12_25890 [Planctomycetes bacterium]|nr:hypothetical protein [Planctomycetota bacterium]